MKYLHYLPVALALAAFVATGCNKEIEPSDVPVEPQDEVEIPEGFVKIDVAAENEQASKTSVSDAGAVTWNALDEIKFLYAGGDCTATTATAGASASFSAVVPESGDLYAVYPSSIGSLTDGTISVTIPSTQDGSFANGNFSAAQVNRSTNAAAFQNITAFLKFTVSNPSVKRIDVESADNDGAHLTGEIDVTFSDYAISLGELSGGGGRVRLNIDEPGTYYVAVAPGLTHGGLSITYYTKDGDNYTALPPYHYNKSITFERNKIKDFGDLYPNPGHLYVSVNGSGTKSGFDAANAMDFERWKTRVVPVSSDNTNTNIAQRKALSGVTFHFAAGTYSFPQTSPINVGSYTGSGIEFTLSGEDGGTIFSGEVSGAATGSILKMGYGTLNIENIIFEYAATTANTTNGAIYVNNKDAIVNLTNCIFRNNGNSTYIGGSIDMHAGTINATGCTFTGNGGKQASCLEMNSSQANATFTNCTFKNNTKQAIRIKNGIASFTNCTFSGNHESGQRGAAASLQLESAQTVTFTGCTFSGNYTEATGEDNAGGAIACEGYGTYDFIECVFSGNHTKTAESWSKDYGGAVTVRGNAIARFNKCRFDDNYATVGGAFEMKSGTATTYLNACIFSGNHITYRHGTTFVATGDAGVVCMNNCTFADNTWSIASNAGQLNWICLKLNGDDQQLVISNCSLIGDLRRNAGLSNYSDGRYGIVRFDGGNGTAAFINNIIAPTLDNSTQGPSMAIKFDSSTTVAVTAVSNKQYSVSDASLYSASGENATDFRGTSNYFGGLSWTGGTSWNDSYWGWNGTLATGSNTNKALLSDINTAIQNANGNFYSWLDSIGALDKDGRGKTRGSSTWPGAYDGTNN